jgi:ankyrin repeat protein
MLSAKANCNDRNIHGQTPLHLAALSLSAQSVSALLQAGAKHDVYDNDLKTPLHYAVIKSLGSVDIARLLIESGANVNSQDKMGFSPLHLAAVNENSQVKIQS